MPGKSLPTLGFVLAFASGASGCATVRTLDAFSDGDPLLFSGTRLNVLALENREEAVRRLGVAPPRYPAVDLPFSFGADLLLVPLLVPAAVANSVLR